MCWSNLDLREARVPPFKHNLDGIDRSASRPIRLCCAAWSTSSSIRERDSLSDSMLLSLPDAL